MGDSDYATIARHLQIVWIRTKIHFLHFLKNEINLIISWIIKFEVHRLPIPVVATITQNGMHTVHLQCRIPRNELKRLREPTSMSHLKEYARSDSFSHVAGFAL
jgi:hypothetical protein